MNKSTTIALFVAVIGSLLYGVLMFGTTPPNIRANAKEKEVAVLSQPVPDPIDYGNNVYYFPFAGSDFGNTLSAFLASHTQLDVAALSAVDKPRPENFKTSQTDGFFVVFKTKN